MTEHLLGLGAETDRRTERPGIPGQGLTCTQLANRRRRVTERRELTTRGLAVRCSACGGTWPCEVGQALGIVAALVRG
jgi:hypothetical protein